MIVDIMSDMPIHAKRCQRQRWKQSQAGFSLVVERLAGPQSPSGLTTMAQPR